MDLVLFVLYGLYYAFTEGIQIAYIADIVSEGQRGLQWGHNALVGLAALPASIIAGFLWKSFGPVFAFSTSSVIARRIAAPSCGTISIQLLRAGPEVVEAYLLGIEGNAPVIVNALEYADLDVLSHALLRVESKGKRFLYRTAASFVKSFGGFAGKALLSGAELTAHGCERNGGIIVAGSHVQKTTNQLERLISGTDITALTLDVERILDTELRDSHVRGLIEQTNEKISSGRNVVVQSSRKLIKGQDKDDHLMISRFVSDALIEIIQSLEAAPRFIIAKGGITSSDVATKGLNIRKAQIIGQAAPGVPVWLTGEETKFPGMPYIVFPGNVGTDTTLLEIVLRVSEKTVV